MCIRDSEYPAMPSINEDKILHIEQTKLASMIRETIFAVSESDVRPIHTGSKFDIQGNELTVVSVDGYRPVSYTHLDVYKRQE